MMVLTNVKSFSSEVRLGILGKSKVTEVRLFTEKLVVTVLLLFVAHPLFAQVTGRVIDSVTKLPVANATVAASSALTFTAGDGSFRLSKVLPGDTIRVTSIGHKPYTYAITKIAAGDTLSIRLLPVSIMLNQVTVKALRNYKLDSLRNRREFGAVFNYQGLAFKDVFINKVNLSDDPFPVNRVRNSSAQLMSVDLLSVLGLAGKKHTSISKLQTVLLRDEEARVAEQRFSKERVEALTTLRGDSLQRFMTLYRPPAEVLKKMSVYEIMTYIKRSFAEFAKKSVR